MSDPLIIAVYPVMIAWATIALAIGAAMLWRVRRTPSPRVLLIWAAAIYSLALLLQGAMFGAPRLRAIGLDYMVVSASPWLILTLYGGLTLGLILKVAGLSALVRDTTWPEIRMWLAQAAAATLVAYGLLVGACIALGV